MFSQTILIGNLGEAAIVRKTGSGKSVTTISLATEEVWRNQDGSKQKRTTWHKVQCWGGHADTIATYCGKGSLLQVIGTYIDEEPWTDKQGIKRQGKILRLDSMNLMPDKNRPNQAPAQQQAAPQKPANGPTYQQLIGAGWTPEQVAADARFAHLVPKPSIPAPPANNGIPAPPEAPQTPVSSQGFAVPDDMQVPTDYGV